MAFIVLFFAAFVFAVVSPAVGQLPGFLSIDCGLEANYSGGYTDDGNFGIVYVPDGAYVDGGQNGRVAAQYESGLIRTDRTLRSFPSGVRNCYALPTNTGNKYLVRVVAVYGNYDGKNSSSTLQFDLHLGVNYWNTVVPSNFESYEALFVAWGNLAPVCLVNTGQGTPFVSSIELRPLVDTLYPDHVKANQSMAMYDRRVMSTTNAYIAGSYPFDRYDRFWWPGDSNPLWDYLNSTRSIQPESSTEVPSALLQKAVQAAGNGTMLNITWQDHTPALQFTVFLHFADFQKSLQPRQFNIYFNSHDKPYLYNPPYLAAGVVYSPSWYSEFDGQFNVTLAATAESVLPPMLNAYEIYTLYGVKKNWMGDPCYPTQYAWDGVKCKNTSENIPRIISIDLSNSNLNGVISSNFTLLTALEYLNLSGNQLNGPIPDSLCKLNAGLLVFSYDSNGETYCNKTTSLTRSRNRSSAAILAISVAAPVLVVIALFIAYLMWKAKRKPNTSAYNPPTVPEPMNAPVSEKYHWDHLEKNENRQFTYEELEKITYNFQRLIGQGGFGYVYHGCLEDHTEVAVKIHSENSRHGFSEFLAEVQSLSKVHHKNLVSLVGYCTEKAHLALVYEYISGGNLFDHLRGLDYLHTGCNRPIIHRDVKTSNILLGHNLQAKIADFGLSKVYVSDTQTHMSATAAGSMGYIDPEYYLTGRITERSDIYSFGVVLLEVVTGERPIIQGQGHIIQRVKVKVVAGDISFIADARLRGDYNVNSIWKVVEIAMLCTEPVAAQRPSMASVVAELKNSLALELSRDDGGHKTPDPPSHDAVAMSSTFGFLSIDCGLGSNHGSYTEKETGIFYVPDGPYVDAGENHEVAADHIKGGHIRSRPDLTVRSFPSGTRNCYTLPTDAGSKYLVRVVVAVYGNYDDGKKNSSVVGLRFDLHLAGRTTGTPCSRPMGGRCTRRLFVAWGSWAPVCLVNTGHGTPFASSVELRPLGSELYPAVMANQSIRLYSRHNLGPTTAHVTRYPNDPFDRYWWHQDTNNPMLENINTTLINSIKQEPSFEVPVAILQNAVEVAGNGTVLNIKWEDDDTRSRQFAVILHFADFQNTASGPPNKYSPPYLAAGYVYSTVWYRAIYGDQFNVTLAATAQSVLPPMLNAYEIYTLIVHDTPTTFQQDGKQTTTLLKKQNHTHTYIILLPPSQNISIFSIYNKRIVQLFALLGESSLIKCLIPSYVNESEQFFINFFFPYSVVDAIWAIKVEYEIKKNWTGDPCFPTQFKWDGVECRYRSDNIRIISIDLANSNLHGVISSNFTLLTALEYLNLSGNQLNGPIPDSLCKLNEGSLVFSYGSNGDICNKTNLPRSKKSAATLAISIAAPVLVVVSLFITYLIWRAKGRSNSALVTLLVFRYTR
uniref:non-specific serine/threonine protein kinase n=1 Tax=Oryza rufipogon TaxID=4529 RepID=A0A0E0QQA9_ORYRU